MLDSDQIILINKELTGEGLLLNKNMLESALSSYFYYDTIEEQISSIL